MLRDSRSLVCRSPHPGVVIDSLLLPTWLPRLQLALAGFYKTLIRGVLPALPAPWCSGEDGTGSVGRTSSGSEDLGGEFDDADEELYLQRTREHLRRRQRRSKSSSAQGGSSWRMRGDLEWQVVFAEVKTGKWCRL